MFQIFICFLENVFAKYEKVGKYLSLNSVPCRYYSIFRQKICLENSFLPPNPLLNDFDFTYVIDDICRQFK